MSPSTCRPHHLRSINHRGRCAAMKHLLLLPFLVLACSTDDKSPVEVPLVVEQEEDTEVPKEGTISIAVQDLQFFHPFSRSRAMLNPTGAKKVSTVRSRDSFGIGLVIDATNESPHLLTKPDLEGYFELVGAHGSESCELTPKRYGKGRGPNHLSLDPRSKSVWLDETKQRYERAWRPGETIRLSARKDCGSFYLLDTALEEVVLRYRITANAMLHPRHAEATFPLPDADSPVVQSDEQHFVLPAEAAILQRTRVNDAAAYIAGDVIVMWDNNKIQRLDLGTLGIRADGLQRTSVPEQFQTITETEAELSISIADTSLHHWVDRPGIGKGRRILQTKLQLSLDESALLSRFSADSDGSPAAASAIAKAVGLERARLSKLLVCQRILLVTSARAVGPNDGNAVNATCSTLLKTDQIDLTMTYNLDRYEVPIGLLLPVDSTNRFIPIDHQALLRFDPR